MKQFFTFLLIFLICISCKKNNSSSEIIDESKPLQEAKIPVSEAVQEIITYYTVRYTARKEGFLALQIEGNFTGSGNREIIGFYEFSRRLPREANIDIAFCFILDSNGESVDNVYTIDYKTWEFVDEQIRESEIGLNEDLGKPIIWRDRVIGSFGDFNKNGKDELFLFRASGLWFRPYFFEFDGNEFKKIIDFVSGDQITILDTDPEKKTIFLRDHQYLESLDYQMYEAIGTYVWDETTQMYERLSYSELKFFRWNRNLQQYEEVKR